MTAIEEKPETAPVPEGHVRLTIDGVEVIAPKGELLIRTAERLGTVIPRFCDHPLLDPAGACRQCLVEVEMGGRPMPKPQASCTHHRRRRHGRQDPADLAGRGQGPAGRDGAAAHQPPAGLPDLRQGRRVPAAEPGDGPRPRGLPVRRDTSGPSRSRSRCPRRCCWTASGACSASAAPGSPTRSPATRSSSCSSAARSSRSASRRTSRSSPTSPATPSRSARSARSPAPPTGSGRGRSTWCPRRASASTARSGCAERTDWRRGKVMRKLAGDDPEVNEEWICDKGRFAFRYVTAGDRITRPLVRDAKTGELRRGLLDRRAAARPPRGWRRPGTARASACWPAAG